MRRHWHAVLYGHTCITHTGAQTQGMAEYRVWCVLCLCSPRSKWNQGFSPSECVVRVSEVTDWEGGGRTEPKHVERVFTKEKTEGERRVLVCIRRGDKVS